MKNRTTHALSVIFAASIIYIIFYFHSTLLLRISEYRNVSKNITPYPTLLVQNNDPVNTDSKLLTPTPLIIKTYPKKTNGTSQSTHPQEDWGVAKDIGDGTYTIRVGEDPAMGTPQEVFAALNNYRNVNGSSSLSWDDNLAYYAQTRAEYMAQIRTTDKHAGFNNYLENEDGFTKLGFNRLGENSYYGGMLNGVHVIEWVFAKSPGHDANQKDKEWSHVGIGVTNSTVNLIFGGSKM